jgi:flagellar M-ring protein FliF
VGADRQVNAFITLVRTLGPARVGAIGTLAAVVLGLAVFAYVRASTPPMRPLFTDLAFDDSAAIVRELDSRDVDYELRGEGSVILVPADRVLALRMDLAETGLPAGGSVGYEIFDSGDGLGATSFVQNLNHLRALEGELARTIRTIDRVRFARVHLVLPERKLFERESTEPSASIALKLRGALSAGQIRAIQHLVASAVKDLKPGRVSVVDDRGELLANGAGDDAQMFASTLEERRVALEERLKSQVEAIVTSVVGPGKARVQVSAEIETARVTDTRDIFDPEGRVLRSSQTREEETSSVDRQGSDAVSVGNELPGVGASQGAAEGSEENATTSEEITNYEISKRTTTEIREAGGVRRLSVAVLVDGLYSDGTNGQPVYAERPQQQLDQIATLVRTAIGSDESRGDTVEVVNLRFAPEAISQTFDDAAGSGIDLTTADYLRIVELVMLAFVGLVLILFVIRPLMRRVLTAEPAARAQLAAPPRQSEPAGEDQTALARPESTETALPAPEKMRAKVDEVIDVARLSGQVQENSIRRVADLVKGNPDEAVAIMRQWLHQVGAR